MKRLFSFSVIAAACLLLTAASCTLRARAEGGHNDGPQAHQQQQHQREIQRHRDFDARRHFVDQDRQVRRYHRESGIEIVGPPVFLFPYDGRDWYCSRPFGYYPNIRECDVEWTLRVGF